MQERKDWEGYAAKCCGSWGRMIPVSVQHKQVMDALLARKAERERTSPQEDKRNV